jgi:Ca2+-binding EF-hand superfamily protein
MESSSSAASTLRPPRIAGGIIAAIATASIAYSLYQAYYDTSEFGGNGLRRSNAIRRPRGPLQRQRTRRNSDVSSSTESNDENAADENTVRPIGGDGETGAEDAATMVTDWEQENQLPPRAGQNIVTLLFRVSEDNARRNAYVHRGCACNGCGLIPIRGIRYRCANCADFDLCETCESQGLHIKTHIFYKVRIPAPPFGPRQSQPVWYPGDPDSSNCAKMLPRPVMARLSRETGFERPELEAFWEQWTFLANTEWREDPLGLCVAMDRKTFERCLVPSGGYRHTAPNLIHDRMFAFYDTNNDDLIGFNEFLHGLSYRRRKDKLKRIFDGYDIDGDGLVSRRDFLRIFRAYYVLYKQMHQDIIEGIDDQVMSSAEVHQLITSRQPLSSYFGREMRLPNPRDRGSLEGKVRADGETFVDDSIHGVVADDKPDHIDRNTILANLFDEYNPRYLQGLLIPPTSVQQLPGFLTGVGNIDDDELFVDQGPSEGHANGNFFDGVVGEPSGGPSEHSRSVAQEHPLGDGAVAASGGPTDDDIIRQGFEDEGWRDGAGGQISLRDRDRLPEEFERIRAQRFHEHQTTSSEDDVPSSRRNERQRAAQRRVAAERSRMVARAKQSRNVAMRRLFDRWRMRQFYLDEEEGAVAPNGFKEEDDFMAHSNDNFNGESSKSAEQPGMMSARSRSNSKVRFAEDTDDYEIRSNPSTSSRSVPERWGGMDIKDAERDAGKEILYQVTQQSFNEMLDTLFKSRERMALEAAKTKELRAKYRSLFYDVDFPENDEVSNHVEEPAADNLDAYRKKTLDELLAASGYTVDIQAEEGKSEEEHQEHEEEGETDNSAAEWEAVEASVDEVRDPTMPQFRPNSGASSTSSAAQVTPLPSTTASSIKGKQKETPPTTEDSEGKQPVTIDRETLIHWKRLTMAEEEAKARGGWGRLNYAEFEAIYQLESEHGNRLDYMGSWIDFCIP